MESSYADGHRVTTWDLPDEAAVSTWTAYAAALLAVQHPALVRVVEADTSTGTARLVLEAEPGEAVDTWVARAEPSVPERLAVLRACASALDALHAGAGRTPGAAHGELRPANVLVRPDESTVVTGFAPWITEEGRFTAPELRAGATSTTAGDAFAFARLTAEVLLGPDELPGETDALVRVLRTHPHTRRRPRLVAAIRDALSGPPETRPRGLQAWLTEATEGTATGGVITEPSPIGSPVAGPRRGRLVGALVALVAVVAAGLAFTAWDQNDGRRDDNPSLPAALEVSASWYPVGTCFGETTSAGTAMDRVGRTIENVSGAHDIALDDDGGRWGRGLAKLTLTSAADEPVVVTGLALAAEPKDAPNWVLIPPSSPCAPPPGRTRHYVLHLDKPWDISIANAKQGMPPQPQFTLKPGATTTLAVDVVACDANSEWRLQVTYYLPDRGLREHHLLTPRLRLYSDAEKRTQEYSGTQDEATHVGRNPRPAGCPL
jgi:hypothetical protein